MAPSLSLQSSISTARRQTGVVIPVYLPQEIDTVRGESLLRDTVASYVRHVDDPAVICLSVDGEEFGAATANQLAKDFGIAVSVSQTNQGKLQSASLGIQYLLENQDLRYFAVVDQDGDHFANELLNLVRVGEHIETHTGTDRVLVLGQRRSPHRSMGFYRGELEELADRVLLDALSYHAAVCGCPLRLEYANSAGEFPDFHSGYKLFSRSTATDVFLSEPQKAGVSDRCYYYHACEAVMTVEALLHEAYLGTAFRSATNEQPISTFGLYDNSCLTADMIIWPCKRLSVPLAFVEQWLANHTPRLLLYTLVPEGRDVLEEVRRLVLASFTGEGGVLGKNQLAPAFT